MSIDSRVVLINSPISSSIPAKFSMLPLGILYIGSYLDKQGYKVTIIDANLNRLTAQEIASRTLSYSPKWVGFSCMTDTLRVTIDAIKMIKEKSKDTRVCVGGAHINATHEEFFEYGSNVDFVIYGEGEINFSKLINAKPEEYATISGLIFKDEKGNIVKNPPSEFVGNLDSFPWLNYELIESFNINNYVSPGATSKSECAMILSRGCPYRCAFCNVKSTFGKKLRLRSVNDSIKEIKDKISKYGIRYISIKDSTFTTNKNWVREFCNRLIEESIDIHWKCNTRVDTIDEDLFVLMKKAGCRVVLIGIESGSQRILDKIKKDVTVKQIYDGVRTLKKLGFILHFSFIIGNPGETKESIEETIKLAKDLRPFFAQFNIATAYPDNYFYDWGIETGALGDPKWYLKGKYKNESLQVLDSEFPGCLTFREFDAYKNVQRAYKEFYFSIGYVLTIIETMKNNFFYPLKLFYNFGIVFLRDIIFRKS